MLFVLLACTRPPEDTGAAETAAPEDAAFPPLDVAAQVARAEGSWSGTADPTPMGAIPFALELAPDEDGSLYGRAERFGFALTFDFQEREPGGWRLVQTGQLRGGALRTYTLAPRSATETAVEWVDVSDPDYLSLVVESGEDTLRMEAFVRGETHAVIELGRADR